MRVSRVGFGIDLGAFGRRGGTALAAAKIVDGITTVTILTGTVLDACFDWSRRIDTQIKSEAKLLTQLAGIGLVAVDVPIHLQKLLTDNSVEYAWELFLRPVDKAFRAMSPTSTYLGHCVGRFAVHKNLSENLVETYPKASLDLCKISRTDFQDMVLGHLADASGDECDAVICALAAVSNDSSVLFGRELDDYITVKLSDFPAPTPYVAPSGYRLLKELPGAFRVERRAYRDWT